MIDEKFHIGALRVGEEIHSGFQFVSSAEHESAFSVDAGRVNYLIGVGKVAPHNH